ncbi:MAG: hypothetical protein H0V17_15630, partial [Deltaproteobacteria bacterium]|nr:hypothetical protein [Deltaproteobacteria bacterium]
MRRIALGLLIGGVGSASADDARDLFGFKPKVAEPVDCTDAKTFGCASSTDPFDVLSPAALRTWLPTSYVLRLPIGDARHDDIVGFATGASRDDVGIAFAGATGLENTWTVEGAPIESLRTGNVDTQIPVAFTTGAMVVAGGFAARDRAALGGSIDVELIRGG